MSLKNDLMFPFGNPYRDELENHATVTALGNVLKLAKDKMRGGTPAKSGPRSPAPQPSKAPLVAAHFHAINRAQARSLAPDLTTG